MKQIIIISAALFLGICQAEAQNYKRPETYNYQRGVEAISQDRKDEALEYFIKDSDENPQSGYPYIWMAYLYLTNEENGKALDAANRAIRFLPKRDVDYLTHAYEYRVGAYLCLGDTVKALADLSQWSRWFQKTLMPTTQGHRFTMSKRNMIFQMPIIGG